MSEPERKYEVTVTVPFSTRSPRTAMRTMCALRRVVTDYLKLPADSEDVTAELVRGWTRDIARPRADFPDAARHGAWHHTDAGPVHVDSDSPVPDGTVRNMALLARALTVPSNDPSESHDEADRPDHPGE